MKKIIIAAMMAISSPAFASAICSDITTLTMAGYELARLNQPLFNTLKVIEKTREAEHIKEAKRAFVTMGYELRQMGLTETQAYTAAREGCRNTFEKEEGVEL